MNYSIEKINNENYYKFEDMIYWRINGIERKSSKAEISSELNKELQNPNLYVYVVCIEQRYVGWISLIYIPKLGKYAGHGHIYIDELWVDPTYRKLGLAKALMNKADELCTTLGAIGERLYVNINNPNAQNLYKKCGYQEEGTTIFMEKIQ